MYYILSKRPTTTILKRMRILFQLHLITRIRKMNAQFAEYVPRNREASYSIFTYLCKKNYKENNPKAHTCHLFRGI